MISLNIPPLTQHISIPKDMSSLSCEAFTAGLVEGVLDGLDFVSHAALLLFYPKRLSPLFIPLYPSRPSPYFALDPSRAEATSWRTPLTLPPSLVRSSFALPVFASQPAKVTAHSVPIDGFPLRSVVLIKLGRSVMEREEAFGR